MSVTFNCTAFLKQFTLWNDFPIDLTEPVRGSAKALFEWPNCYFTPHVKIVSHVFGGIFLAFIRSFFPKDYLKSTCSFDVK